jgi:hypothetical protein
MAMAPTSIPTGRKNRDAATPKYFNILPVRNNWIINAKMLKVDTQKPKNAVS